MALDADNHMAPPTSSIVSHDGTIRIEFPRALITFSEKLRMSQVIDTVSHSTMVDTIHPLAVGSHEISLRFIDFLCVNYSRITPVIYKVKLSSGHEVLWNLHKSYCEWLRCWKRRNYDVFRRRQCVRCTFTGRRSSVGDAASATASQSSDPVVFYSTPGQLNFMLWVAQYNVIDYCLAHKDIVQRVMIKTYADAKLLVKNKKRKRRSHITEASNRVVFVYKKTRTVFFDSVVSADVKAPRHSKLNGHTAQT
jgi:hypothetical protein